MAPILVVVVWVVVGVTYGSAELTKFSREQQFNETSPQIAFVPGSRIRPNLTEEYHEGFTRFQNAKGKSIHFYYAKTICYNLPTHWTGTTALVYNPFNCVTLYELGDCGGSGTQVPSTNVNDENDFTVEEAFHLNKTVRSFRPRCTE